MSKDCPHDAAARAFKLGQAHVFLRKVEKIFIDLNVATDQVESDLLQLLEFCNEKVMEIKEKA